MSIGVALIGSGIWARDEHLASTYLIPKAVYSRSQKSVQTITDSCSDVETCADDVSPSAYGELLQRADIQAVISRTCFPRRLQCPLPIKNQNKYIREALLMGKHVLSEKPVAEYLKEDEDTMKWYREEISGPTWCIAENWQFLKGFEIAAQHAKQLGKFVGLQVRSFATVQTDLNFYNTEWRKNPTHQGGFLLDGGVRHIERLRQLLEAARDSVKRVSVFTTLLKDYLPPLSVGTTLQGDEWTIACEEGVISLNDAHIEIVAGGEERVLDVPNERMVLSPEVRAWGKALAEGKTRSEQEPELALGDLELIELILRSGEQDGAPIACRLQKTAS
ncbi:NAD-binding Rossmann fold oxidoreductase family protein [Corynespora cassiicola Philippines]|uniref:NAD-binding Rossmann fold oxidoreductase family protein n=1 Tax=Corynespora cassiicola Philippines TaxID=1448308 RepID=A0A2T2N5H5_CORCC|nr:NAD-binding Rossmann fold oxidoreductase family protein [Corynespora cassiicola Philippines]